LSSWDKINHFMRISFARALNSSSLDKPINKLMTMAIIRRLFAAVLIAFLNFAASAQTVLKTPEQFLGYSLGERFTRHHRVVEYMEYLSAGAGGRMVNKSYGTTNEGRPLMLSFISSPENIRRLEEIRMNNLRLAGLSRDRMAPSEDMPVIVWLSYNVHGNEASSMEAVMKTVHTLLSGQDPRTAGWLEKAVIVIDPCINPDGRDRYANWYNSVATLQGDPDQNTREHREPWPGGRVNHYYFDLNRDWAWQSQTESRSRLKVYNDWMPQVHVDFHEQSPNSPYYFAPAAEPYHEVITPWQREFQQMIGKNNAGYFDRQGWLYFTRERFDLLYPSYGDTYPVYNGAIGMTFEQGGGSRAGKAVLLEDGDTLTLAARLEHHHTTGLSTIEVSVREAARLRQEFRKFFAQASAEIPAGGVQYYLVRRGSSPGADGGVVGEYLRRNGIDYGFAQTKLSLKGFGYRTGKDGAVSAEPGDILIPARQPRATMLRVLFEPRTKLTDSATYDITAWSLPYAFGLDAWAVTDKPAPAGWGAADPVKTPSFVPADDAYAYVIPWQGMHSARVLARLLRDGLTVRYSTSPFTVEGRKHERGSLIVTRAANRLDGRSLGEKVRVALASVPDAHLIVTAVKTGLVEQGFDFGSGDVRPIRAPRVAALAGEGIVSNGFGEVWHFFEQQLGYPLSILNVTDIAQLDLSRYDVIIMPDGNYRMLSDRNFTDALKSWVRKGGRLIAMENAVAQMANWGLRLKKEDDKSGKDGADSLLKYADREKNYLKGSIPGSIYRVDLDETHPLAFGYSSPFFTLKQDDHLYEFLKDGGWNVGVIRKDAHVSGFAGVKVKQRLKDGLLFAAQDLGSGTVVSFADNPIFRGFWEGGKLMFANAVFLAGQ
jgi:hypothetical protein